MQPRDWAKSIGEQYAAFVNEHAVRPTLWTLVPPSPMAVSILREFAGIPDPKSGHFYTQWLPESVSVGMLTDSDSPLAALLRIVAESGRVQLPDFRGRLPPHHFRAVYISREQYTFAVVRYANGKANVVEKPILMRWIDPPAKEGGAA